MDFDGDSFSNITEIHVRTFPGAPNSYKWIADFDKDGKTDITVYRSGTGAWYVYPSGGGSPYGFGWGGDATDKPVLGDYDGDGKTDIAIYRSSNGGWYIVPSSGASPYGLGWGGDPSDIPLTEFTPKASPSIYAGESKG